MFDSLSGPTRRMLQNIKTVKSIRRLRNPSEFFHEKDDFGKAGNVRQSFSKRTKSYI